jgi:hypothetical protein
MGKKVAVSADFAALVGKNSQNLRSFEQVVRDSVPFWPVFSHGARKRGTGVKKSAAVAGKSPRRRNNSHDLPETRKRLRQPSHELRKNW